MSSITSLDDVAVRQTEEDSPRRFGDAGGTFVHGCTQRLGGLLSCAIGVAGNDSEACGKKSLGDCSAE